MLSFKDVHKRMIINKSTTLTCPDWLCYISLAFLICIYFLPFCDSRNFFLGDDFVWLYQARFGRFVPTLGPYDISFDNKFGLWALFYQIIPTAVYNDRLMGHLFFKLIYVAFGLCPASYYIGLFLLHVYNTLAFYKFSTKYLSTLSAWIGAALAGTWCIAIEAAYRLNSIFDVLALSFSLTTILVYQKYSSRQKSLGYFVSALLYYAAIRTKEYSIGIIAVLFFIDIILERKKLKQSLKDLWIFFTVSLLIMFRYVYLFFDKSTTVLIGSGTAYNIKLNLLLILNKLYYYFSEVFYKQFCNDLFFYTLFLAFIFVFFISSDQIKRKIYFGILTFITLMGPVLFFDSQCSFVYLYAPHFFLAFTLASSLDNGFTAKLITFIIISCLCIIPFTSNYKKHTTEWYLALRGDVKEQLLSSIALISGSKILDSKHGTLFISGVKPELNAFSTSWALSTLLGIQIENFEQVIPIYVLGQRRAPTMDEFLNLFCLIDNPKIHIEFNNNKPYDKTSTLQKQCEKIFLRKSLQH